MDPVLKAFADNYGIWWTVAAAVGGFLATLTYRLIPVWVEQRRLKTEREDRVLKAFEDSARTTAEHTTTMRAISESQQKAFGAFEGNQQLLATSMQDLAKQVTVISHEIVGKGRNGNGNRGKGTQGVSGD